MQRRFTMVSWFLALTALLSPSAAQTTSTISATPATMSFTYQLGTATLPTAQTLQVTSVPPGLKFTISVTGAPSNGAWLLVSASTGTAPASLKVQVNPTGLVAGVYSGTITATGTTGAPAPTKSIPVTLTITSPPPTLVASPTSLNFTYIIGNPIPAPNLTSQFVLASAGTPLSATVSAANAPWLKLNPTGSISLAGLLDSISVTVDPTGLAPKAYSATVTINAPGAANKTLSLPVTLTVNAAIPIASATWPSGLIQGSAASIITLVGSGFYSNSTVAATGFTSLATITVTDSAGSPATATETIGIPIYAASYSILHTALATTLPSGVQGVAYAKALAASGGTAPYTWSQGAGALPPGLNIAGGFLTGAPTTPGTYTFGLQVTDAATPFPATAYQQFRLTVYPAGSAALAITVAAAPLPSGQVGAAYNQTLTVSGGTGPYTWSASGLPAGMTLSAGGVLSGNPTSVGLTGALSAALVSNSALLVTVPATFLANPGVLRMAVTTPAPGGGVSNDAQLTIYGPAPQISSVVNSASYSAGAVTPGEIITIFGVGLGPSTLSVFDPTTPPIPTSLPSAGAATSVTIGGVAAPIIYTSATQISAIVPYTVAGPSAAIVVTYGGLNSLTYTVSVSTLDPGVYTIGAGTGQAAMLNYNAATNDYTVNSASAAAAKGSIVVLYVTGVGAMSSAVSNQLIPAAPAVTPTATVTVSIGGQNATVNAAVAPPGSVPGVLQVNAVVPASITSGAAIPVIVNVGGVDSQANVMMAVK